MSIIPIDDITIKVMKEAYATAKKHTEHPDDTVFIAGAFINVARNNQHKQGNH